MSVIPISANSAKTANAFPMTRVVRPVGGGLAGRVGYLPASRMKGMVIASSLWVEAGGR
jgi:hypothetical protein